MMMEPIGASSLPPIGGILRQTDIELRIAAGEAIAVSSLNFIDCVLLWLDLDGQNLLRDLNLTNLRNPNMYHLYMPLRVQSSLKLSKIYLSRRFVFVPTFGARHVVEELIKLIVILT